MIKSVFYSWQSDTESKFNRNFIKKCLEESIKKLNQNLLLEDAIRIDQDTKGIPGIPDIANTIFAKIDVSDVFLADLTTIAKSINNKNIPNPNVLIELGYALKSIGSDNVIIIMNEHYGSPKDGLPFDLSHKRWPIVYNLSDSSSPEEFKEQKNNLVTLLTGALKLILESKTKSPKAIREMSISPTHENIMRVILESEPKDDWNVRQIGQIQLFVFKHNVNLRLLINYDGIGVHADNFNESWATKHPDNHASSYYCDIKYGPTVIEQKIVVSVDGGRAILPLPKINTLEYSSLDYKIAKIVDTSSRTDEYIKRSGLKLGNQNCA